MPDLIAQGPKRHQRWRRHLPEGEQVTVGRAAGGWSVPWDEHISRHHVQLRSEGDLLSVTLLALESNPVFFQGQRSTEFQVRPGEHFVIGSTTFAFSIETASVAMTLAPPATEQTFSPAFLRQLRFRDPSQRLELLSRLPERLATAEDATLYQRTVEAALDGVPQAAVAMLCAWHNDQVACLHWDRHEEGGGPVQASQQLIEEAIKRQESVVHTWESSRTSPYTEADDLNWAFATPFTNPACGGWALYVAGTEPLSAPDLREEMKFAEILVTMVGSFSEVRHLQKRQSALGQFFSPPVALALAQGDPDEVLAPQELEVTVLFCDLRGFSLETERSAHDLRGLLARVSDALGLLTREILAEGGVIGDFHGDAAMGFWGWPLPQADAAERAARTAIAIGQAWQQEHQNGSLPFQVGIGIASGRAVAGKIGTSDQVKITAFGPAVNLAARLEGMTKHLNAPVLIDAATAEQLRGTNDVRLRRLARIMPYGMTTAIDVHEVLPCSDQFPMLTDEHLAAYESALDAFVSGDWTTAWETLHQVPAADTSKDLLTTYIASRSRTAPPDWDGIIRLQSK